MSVEGAGNSITKKISSSLFLWKSCHGWWKTGSLRSGPLATYSGAAALPPAQRTCRLHLHLKVSFQIDKVLPTWPSVQSQLEEMLGSWAELCKGRFVHADPMGSNPCSYFPAASSLALSEVLGVPRTRCLPISLWWSCSPRDFYLASLPGSSHTLPVSQLFSSISSPSCGLGAPTLQDFEGPPQVIMCPQNTPWDSFETHSQWVTQYHESDIGSSLPRLQQNLKTVPV